MRAIVLLLVLLVPHGVPAQPSVAGSGKLYTALHPLLVDTLKQSKVEGVMTGDIANAFNNKLGLQGPVYVKSELVERLAQTDCGRIKVVFTKRGVSTPIGVTDANLRTEMKYCKDGSPPGAKDEK
jgi:hypothetical protein